MTIGRDRVQTQSIGPILRQLAVIRVPGIVRTITLLLQLDTEQRIVRIGPLRLEDVVLVRGVRDRARIPITTTTIITSISVNPAIRRFVWSIPLSPSRNSYTATPNSTTSRATRPLPDRRRVSFAP